MKQFVISIIILIGTCFPINIYAQNKNRIFIQTGLFHHFFDKSPILNVNYMSKARGIFGGLFYNSLGLEYSRKINSFNSISLEYMYFYEYYWNVHPNLLKNVISDRNYNTFNINYERKLPLSNQLDITLSSGLIYRQGKEVVVVNYGYSSFYESLNHVRMLNDIGLNLRAGIEYSPLKWLTLSTKFDLIGLVYMHDKKSIRDLKEHYEYKKYPHRFDVSWRFGIGFNF